MIAPDLSAWPRLKVVYEQFVSTGILSEAQFNALTAELQSQAFVTLGASDEIIAAKLTDLIGKAISEGMLDSDFIKAADPLLENPSYWGLVFHMNVQTAFNNGHYAEAFFGPYADDFVAWQFIGATPAEEPDCPNGICAEMYELAFDKYDPEARRRLPFEHFGCHHFVRWLTQEEADAIGITDASEMPEPAEGFGDDKIDALPEALKAA
jgi:hypothetical protein